MRGRAIFLAGALSFFIGIESAEAKLEILVDKSSQRMVVIQDGYMRYIWPVSTGSDELETPNGTYTPERLERSWFSREYYSSPMPYSIFFHNGYAIHGSSAINQLGGPASHGCVRLHPHHAALLFDLVQQEGPENTTIEVTDEPRPEMPPSRPRESEQAPEISPDAAKPERFGDFSEMAELSAQRPIRPATVRTPLPSRSSPTDRRLLTNLIESVNSPRGPCGVRADFTDCRTKPKPAEGPTRERAEAAPPTQPARRIGPAGAAGAAGAAGGLWLQGAARLLLVRRRGAMAVVAGRPRCSLQVGNSRQAGPGDRREQAPQTHRLQGLAAKSRRQVADIIKILVRRFPAPITDPNAVTTARLRRLERGRITPRAAVLAARRRRMQLGPIAGADAVVAAPAAANATRTNHSPQSHGDSAAAAAGRRRGQARPQPAYRWSARCS